MANSGRKKSAQNCHEKGHCEKHDLLKRISKTFAYLIMKIIWIEKNAKNLSHSINVLVQFWNISFKNIYKLYYLFKNGVMLVNSIAHFI